MRITPIHPPVPTRRCCCSCMFPASAMTQLCAVDLTYSNALGDIPILAIAFAPPRIGNKYLAQWVEEQENLRIIRVRNPIDDVTNREFATHATNKNIFFSLLVFLCLTSAGSVKIRFRYELQVCVWYFCCTSECECFCFTRRQKMDAPCVQMAEARFYLI